MTSTARLAELERALSPLEAVLAWLEEAHAHDSADDYVRAIVDLPEDEQPLTVMVGRVEAWARTRYRDHDDDQLKARLIRAQEISRYVEHGMLDAVVPRHELKRTLARCLTYFQ